MTSISNSWSSKAKNKPKNVFFRNSLLFLVWASIILSMSTLILSWIAIENDVAVKEGLHGGNKDTALDLRSPKKTRGKRKRPEKDEKPQHDSGISNNQIYQPTQKGKRLLTYKRFGGRLNNQLFQFITALQHAKVLKRTFVVPDEVREVEWTGMFDTSFGIWDLSSLNKAYDIDWTTAFSPNFEVPEECVLSPRDGAKLLKGGPKLWVEWDKKCPDIIDLAGNTGLLFCDGQHQFCGDAEAQEMAYDIYKHLKLSPSLLQYIPSKSKEFKDQGFDELAVHSRRAGEGGYSWELCIKGNKRTCSGHVDTADLGKYCDERTMKGNCAVWLDFDYQIKSKKFLKKKRDQYKFVLASDGTHDWSIDFDGQFIVANNTEWLLKIEKKAKERDVEGMAISTYAKSKLRGQKDLSKIKSTLDALSATLLDLFSLVDSKYLLGAYYSTLSLNACYFRGPDRMYDSNMCWMLMHPKSKYAISPPLKNSAHIDGDSKNMNDLPAALMSDVEHAFVRSNDGKFIAIDRYIIPYDILRSRKPRDLIGVVGDGEVPLTITTNELGDEMIEAGFTCSMGNQLDTRATVLLMKGDKTYEEHYFKRGEKYKTPFSTNGDRFRTLIIVCEELFFDKSLSRHPPLILKSPDSKFSLRIGSTFARQMKEGDNVKNPHGKQLVHCLNPVYGLTDPRWIIEYLEYHRAIGVSHVHIYNVNLHAPSVQQVLEVYRRQKFITRHDWSDNASKGYTTHVTYEHAKWAAQTDCAIRNRRIYDYALFSDIDEVAFGALPDGKLGPALDVCEKAKKNDGKVACSFNSNTVTSIYTKLNDEEEASMENKLLLERYTHVEADPHCPANCKCDGGNCTRKFHNGRQKYIANVGDIYIPPRPMWTHALSRDYDEMEKVMEVLPDEVMHVRHYQGHWYLNKNLLDTIDELERPLSPTIMNVVRKNIQTTPDLNAIYTTAKRSSVSQGIEWINPVDRPPKYHHDLL